MGDPSHPVGFPFMSVNSESSTASGGAGGSAGRAWEVYFARKVSRKTEYQMVVDFEERRLGVPWPGHEILY